MGVLSQRSWLLSFLWVWDVKEKKGRTLSQFRWMLREELNSIVCCVRGSQRTKLSIRNSQIWLKNKSKLMMILIWWDLVRRNWKRWVFVVLISKIALWFVIWNDFSFDEIHYYVWWWYVFIFVAFFCKSDGFIFYVMTILREVCFPIYLWIFVLQIYIQ